MNPNHLTQGIGIEIIWAQITKPLKQVVTSAKIPIKKISKKNNRVRCPPITIFGKEVHLIRVYHCAEFAKPFRLTSQCGIFAIDW